MSRTVVLRSGIRWTIPGQTETAATRVTAYLDAMTRHSPDDLTIGLGLTRVGGGDIHRNPLTLADLRGLLDLLGQACDDHESCEHCQTWMCNACGIGQTVECVAEGVHCLDCVQHCGPCQDEAARERRAEIAADVDLERCE